MEETFVMIKPDGVRRGLVGECIRRFEERGLKLVRLKLLTPDRPLAEQHYGAHRDKPFFGGVVSFITSGPVVAMVLEGESAIAAVRQMVGATRPLEAAPGSIRGDYALEVGENIVHASDGPEAAQEEIALWFGRAG
jgi:nucleoside-diphosphate kinase